jgi:uncharacterized membrane protein YqaE (UPF0057 family)
MSGLHLHSDICKFIFAIILPPLGVFLERGCGADLLINICLTILGYIPGILHALYVVCSSQASEVYGTRWTDFAIHYCRYIILKY